MFQRGLLLLLLLSLCTNIQAQNSLETVPTTDVEDLSDLSVSKTLNEEIFFTNPEKTVYYIDFEATKTVVSQIQVWKNQEVLVYNESTSELPYNTIYELKISDLSPGEYSIELTTTDEDVFIQVFDVPAQKEELVEKGDKK